MGSRGYTYAYGEAGAVQCGFCIRVWSCVPRTSGLRNPDPDGKRRLNMRFITIAAVPAMKIIAAVKLRQRSCVPGKIPAAGADDWLLGSRVHRLDVEGEGTLGYGKYPDDYYPGWHDVMVRRSSKLPRQEVCRLFNGYRGCVLRRRYQERVNRPFGEHDQYTASR